LDANALVIDVEYRIRRQPRCPKLVDEMPDEKRFAGQTLLVRKFSLGFELDRGNHRVQLPLSIDHRFPLASPDVLLGHLAERFWLAFRPLGGAWAFHWCA
jgi:hypothetical protein